MLMGSWALGGLVVVWLGLPRVRLAKERLAAAVQLAVACWLVAEGECGEYVSLYSEHEAVTHRTATTLLLHGLTEVAAGVMHITEHSTHTERG